MTGIGRHNGAGGHDGVQVERQRGRAISWSGLWPEMGMQRNVVSVKPDTRLSEAVSLLLRRGLRSLPVTDVDGRAIGS